MKQRAQLFALCLLITCQIASCKKDSTEAAEVLAAPVLGVPEMALPAPVPVETVHKTPTVAIYPLLPGPNVQLGQSVDAHLMQLEHEMLSGTGNTDSMIVLDRSGSTSNVLSLERKSLATTGVADYVLSGLLNKEQNHSHLRLQLTQVASHRLVATAVFLLDSSGSIDKSELVEFVLEAIEYDRSREPSGLGLRVSLAGIFPTDESMYRMAVTRDIQHAVAAELLKQPQYTIVSTELAHALYLESNRSTDNGSAKRADIIIHARLLSGETEAEGHDLVLFIERLQGVRKVIPLHASSTAELAPLIVQALSQQLSTYPAPSPDDEQQAQLLVDEAMGKLYKNGRLFVNGFPYKITDRNKPRLDAFESLLDEALVLNPANPEAIAGRILLDELLGEYQSAYNGLQSLLWDHRPRAFDLGVQIMRQKIHQGTNIYSKGAVAGISAFATEQEAINELIQHDWLTKTRNDEKLWWNSNGDHAPMAATDAHMWEYILGTRNPDLDSLVRFKLMRRPLPTHHSSRPGNLPTGIDYRQSIYYALANTMAPLSLSVGRNGYYSAPVDMQNHVDDPTLLTQERLYLFQSLAGMAALSQTKAIEPDLLYAASQCRYRQTLCTSSQNIYEAITYRSDKFRQHVVAKARDAERTTLYADGLIAMARKGAHELGKRKKQRHTPLPSTAQSRQISGLQRIMIDDLKQVDTIEDVFEPCSDCAGLKTLRGVHASPNGRWWADSERNHDAPGRYVASSDLVDWFFNQGYLDIAGEKTVTRLSKDVLVPLLSRDFPAMSEHQISKIIADFNKSHYKVRDTGQVKFSLEGQQSIYAITSPDLRAEAHFGNQVALSDDAAIICDQWQEGHQFLLSEGAWERIQPANEFCDGSHLAMVDDWVIKANGASIAFFKDVSSGFTRQAIHDINRDFDSLIEGSFVQSIRAHQDLMVAKIRYRNDYFLSVYQLKGNHWQPVSLTEVPGFFPDFDVFDDQVFQLHGNTVLVYELENSKLQLLYQYPIPKHKNRSPPGFMMVASDKSGEKLVVDANGVLTQIRLH